MKFSKLVGRISGDGADAWKTHYQASRARERGEDVILLSVGDPDLDTPAARRGPRDRMSAGGRYALYARGRARTRCARRLPSSIVPQRSGGRCSNVIFLAGAQNALFAASLCLAGPGDEVIAFEPLYPTYPATIEVSGARMVRAPAAPGAGFRVDPRSLEALITPRIRARCFSPLRTIPAASS